MGTALQTHGQARINGWASDEERMPIGLKFYAEKKSMLSEDQCIKKAPYSGAFAHHGDGLLLYSLPAFMTLLLLLRKIVRSR
ncbi:hypothetical protein WJR50_14045 [Catalinimonas sp. 4WD22]|uniref:hypothetical protein n=1 Tax=Catalinimonas locisalis TaxID=3133978 RepID=UPI00310173E1